LTCVRPSSSRERWRLQGETWLDLRVIEEEEREEGALSLSRSDSHVPGRESVEV
jgi:hypothetical protein